MHLPHAELTITSSLKPSLNLLFVLCPPGVDGLSLPSRTSEVRLHCPPDTEWGDVAFALAYLRHTKATQGKSPGAHAPSSAGGTPSTSGSTATAGGTAGECTKHMSACPPAPDAHLLITPVSTFPSHA